MLEHPGLCTSHQVPLVVVQDNVLNKTVRGLAVTQIIIGILSVLIGIVIVLIGIWNYSFGQGIWGGGWIIVTGIIGIASSNNSSSCVTGTYMAFSIVSTVVTFCTAFILGVGISYYSSCYYYNPYDPTPDPLLMDCLNQSTTVFGLFIPLLLLMIVEFFVSIVAAMYSCKSINCCRLQQPGVIIAQQQPYQIMPSNQGQTVIASPSGYPVVSYPAAGCATTGYYQPQYPGYPQQAGAMSTPGQMYPGPVVSQPHTGAMYVSSQGQPISPQTNIVYSAQPNAPINNVAPPPYDTPLETGVKIKPS